ncbi:MAG TPA: metallopeptidase family protein [Marmoricola sp.]|nr:metallopeptidase family protein [Marmoricola sp.]
MVKHSPGRLSVRDRHGRGLRGLVVVPVPDYHVGADRGLLDQQRAARRIPARRTRRQRFDEIAISVMADIESRWKKQLAFVELAVEEVPVLPQNWTGTRIPLASLVAGTATTPPRVVLFRQPIESRAQSRSDLEAMLLTCLVEQVAGFLGISPAEVHPRYPTED